MQLGVRAKLLVFPAILIVLSLVHYSLVNLFERRVQEQLGWVAHTHNVILQGESLLGYLRDAETGQRGYLLTLEPAYLDSYHWGVATSKERYRELQELTRNNRRQQALLLEIDSLMTRKFAELAETILWASSDDLEKALSIVKSDLGKQLMDQMRGLLDQFISEQQRLLEVRLQALEDTKNTMRYLFFAEALISILLAVFIWSYIQRSVIQPLVGLSDALKKVSGGASEITIQSRSDDEIGLLIEEFKAMQRRIQVHGANLESLHEELKIERDKALAASVRDELTGLYNRRNFETIALQELARARRNGEAFNLYMIDVDFFKAVNDCYGHAHGDQVLIDVAECLKDMSRRPSDFVFRFGGEEFVLLTTGQAPEVVQHYAELIRLAIESLAIPNRGSKVSQLVTASIGVVAQYVNDDSDIYELLKLADQRLYRAKQQGRNQAVVD